MVLTQKAEDDRHPQRRIPCNVTIRKHFIYLLIRHDNNQQRELP